jgi:tRNA G10  N-methylase Trm11
MRYYVQFVAGTGSLVLEALDAQLDGLRVRYADDSAMILETSASPNKVAAISYMKNAFVVVADTGRGSVDKGVLQLSRVISTKQFPKLSGQTGRFRIMVHVDGTLTPVEPLAKGALEKAVMQRTGARVEPRGQCQEYWVVGRQGMRELLFCARLPKAQRPAKAKGAVSHELSAMLVAASLPTPQDVFLDPFAGSGAFITARLEQPLKQAWYVDHGLARYRSTLARQLTDNKRVRLVAEDALTLPSLADGSVDVIVTDPPWGEHEVVKQPYEQFARDIADSFARVLHPVRGRYVLLVNRRNASVFGDALAAAGLSADTEHKILVNGHPASVLIGRRPSAASANVDSRTTARTAR